MNHLINWCRISSIHHMTLTLSHRFFEVHAEACGDYITGNLRYPPTKTTWLVHMSMFIATCLILFRGFRFPQRTTKMARISEKDPLLAACAPEGRLRSWICRSSSSTKSKFFRGKSATCITKQKRLGAAVQRWRGYLGIIGHGSLNVPIEHHPTIRYMVYKCI